MGRALAIAHRGDPIAFRENTIPSIQSAIDAGADVVEIDVKTTSDGVSVVLHDDSLDRLWGVPRDVREMSAAEVAAVGVDGMRVPTLAEVLTLFSGRPVAVLVDLDSIEWVPAALAVVRRAVAAGAIRADQVLWCGVAAALLEVRAADPDARIYLSWGTEVLDRMPSDALMTQLRPEAFNPNWQILDHGGWEWAREKDVAVSCWTVDDRARMAGLLAEGVVGIISNDVRAVVAAVADG